MILRTLPVATLFLTLTAASPVLAQGTDEQRSACSGDAFRLCASAIPNVGKISACMRAKREQLSPGCRLVMDKTDGGNRDIAEAPPPRVAEKPKSAAREVRKPAPSARETVAKRSAPASPRVAQREEPRATPRPAARETVARRQALASPRVAQREEPRATPRPSARVASARQTPRVVASRASGPRRPYYGRSGNSDYAEADYWMRRVTGSGIGEATASLAGFETLFR